MYVNQLSTRKLLEVLRHASLQSAGEELLRHNKELSPWPALLTPNLAMLSCVANVYKCPFRPEQSDCGQFCQIPGMSPTSWNFGQGNQASGAHRPLGKLLLAPAPGTGPAQPAWFLQLRVAPACSLSSVLG